MTSLIRRCGRELTCGVKGDEERLLAPGSRWKFWVAVGVLIVGLFLIGSGTGVYFYLDARLRSEVNLIYSTFGYFLLRIANIDENYCPD